uniref:Terminase-like family n=1 Tax=Candidatus Kentrum sp. LPFa TaxID=2126335 RepID=A0A450W4U4_9GAMM|nr:MAG: Terminase-like family [Candidatus Kentron sp. LPFa]
MAQTIRFSYAGSPTLQAFARSDAFLRQIIGPFGSGKSSACVAEIVRRAHQQQPGPDGLRKTRTAVIRNTEKELHKTTVKTVLEWLPESAFGRFNKSELVYYVTGFQGVSLEIHFLALDRPDQVRDLLSAEFTFAWVNESREIQRPIVNALTGRVDRYPSRREDGVGATWAGVFMDTNPPPWRHWIVDVFEKGAEGGKLVDTGDAELDALLEERLAGDPNARPQIFRQPSGLSAAAENRAHLADNYYPRICIGKGRDWIKVNVEAEYGFVQDGMPVFPEYKDSLHCREIEPIPGRRIWRGWDYGLTPACVFIQTTANGQFRVIDEMVATRAGIETFTDRVIEYCAEKYPGYEFEDIGDPAGATPSQTDMRTCYQIQHAKGVLVRPGRQSVTLRLASVREPLTRLIDGEPGFVVSPRAELIREGLQGAYRYKKADSGDQYKKEPEKNAFSHPHDAMQYVATEIHGDTVLLGDAAHAPVQTHASTYAPGADFDPMAPLEGGFDPYTARI